MGNRFSNRRQVQQCAATAKRRWDTKTKTLQAENRLEFYKQEKEKTCAFESAEMAELNSSSKESLRKKLEPQIDEKISDCEEKIHCSKKILDALLKAKNMERKNTNVLIVGPAGSGKTCTKLMLFNKRLPETCKSTGVAEEPLLGRFRSYVKHKMPHRGSYSVPSGASSEMREDHHDVRHVESNMVCATDENEWKEVDSDSFLETIIIENMNAESVVSSPVESGNNFLETIIIETPILQRRTSPAGSPICEFLTNMVTIVQQKTDPEISSVVSENSEGSNDWIYFIDSGGQPHFYNLLPYFVQGFTVVLFTLRLCDKLDDHPQVEYHVQTKGNLTILVHRKSPFSVKETILHLVNTLQCHTVKGQKPHLVFIGTFYDQIEESGETLEQKNKQLIDLLAADYGEQIVFHGEGIKKVIFPINAKKPGESEQRVANAIRKTIVEYPDKEESPTPSSYYVLGIFLDKIAKGKKRRVLSLDECIEAARELKIDTSEIEKPLEFLHQKHLIHYYPSILPNVIFTSTQVLFDKLTELVVEAYRLRTVQNDERNSEFTPTLGLWIPFRDKGIITLKLLQDKKLKQHYEKNIFTASDLLKIFHNKLIVAPLSKGEPTYSPEDKFYMPSLLDAIPTSELEKYRTSSVEPLILCLPKGLPWLGVFCSVQVYLIQNGWTLSLRDTSPELIAQNAVILLPPNLSCTITIIYSFSYIELYVATEVKDPTRICKFIHGYILDAIKEAHQALDHDVKDGIELAFFCPCNRGDKHIAKIGGDNYNYIRCSVNSNYIKRIDENCRYQMWASTQLNTSDLYTPFTIILSVNTHLDPVYTAIYDAQDKWKDIARKLGISNADIESIKRCLEHSEGPGECLYQMLVKWMHSGCATIIELLRALETPQVAHKDIADEIRARQGDARAEIGLSSNAS